jgi:N-acylglucosamine 2-epimerase
VQVASWAYAHLVDSAAGEWWGYADRAGVVTHRFKGGPYKGCFHVPRALLYVDRVLSAVLQGAEGGATSPA